MSSREDHGRYRGRRRAPSQARGRYAAVITTAFVGAGVVALGAAAALPDHSADSASLNASSANSALNASDLTDRQATLDRATRGDNRDGATTAAADSVAPDMWVLPASGYTLGGQTTQGVDLNLPEGTPFVASHAGTVVLARFQGGYGLLVEIDCGNGITMVYAHSSELMVREGQQVEAGQLLGYTGASGYATTPHLLLEVHQNGTAVNPVAFLLGKLVDLKSGTDALSG